MANETKTAEKIAEKRSQSPSSNGITAEPVDKQKAAEIAAAEKRRKDRLARSTQNSTKLVKMRANTYLKLPKEVAKELKTARDVKAGEVVTVPVGVAEMYCDPVTGFYADEGGQWSGTNRPKHQLARAEIVQ